jgi:hypothetical protein
MKITQIIKDIIFGVIFLVMFLIFISLVIILAPLILLETLGSYNQESRLFKNLTKLLDATLNSLDDLIN